MSSRSNLIVVVVLPKRKAQALLVHVSGLSRIKKRQLDDNDNFSAMFSKQTVRIIKEWGNAFHFEKEFHCEVVAVEKRTMNKLAAQRSCCIIR
jgi:hypothetical protein